MMSDKNKQTYNPDITEDDKQALGQRNENLRSDQGADQPLKDRERDVDFVGKDLDVPGRSIPSERTKKTLKDEENQLYGQGGPGNEGLERNDDHTDNR